MNTKETTSREMSLSEVDKIPGLKQILDNCQKEVEQLTGYPVSVFYRLKFHHLTTSELIRIICDVCEVTWPQIVSDSRRIHIVIARQLFCWFALTVQQKTLSRIGEILGRDHTTVIHSRNKVLAMKETGDELWMSAYTEIENRINSLVIVHKSTAA